MDNIHPYNNHSDVYNFFLHPSHFKDERQIFVLSIITNIFITIITAGIYLIPFLIINHLDNRDLEVWESTQANKISEIASSFFSQNAQVGGVANDQLTSQIQLEPLHKTHRISEELMQDLVETMLTHGCQIPVFIYQSYYFPPRDPFDLFIYHALDRFQFNSSISKDIYKHIKEHIQERLDDGLEYYEIDPSHEVQVLETFCQMLGLTDEGLYENYRSRSIGLSPLRSPAANMLLSYYFRKRTDVVFLDFTGENYLEAKDPVHKIAICGEIPYISKSESEVHEFVSTILANELNLHRNTRPKAILIPFGFCKQGTSAHQVFLAVEPSRTNQKEARITMVNTHGNHIKSYLTYEQAAMNAAGLVYNDPKTVIKRNEKRLWATPSCTHNAIDIMRQMVNVPNIQEAIENGLEPMTEKKDKQSRLEHGKKIKLFLKEKLAEAEELKKNIHK